jgi:hypothetical protein
MLASEKKARGYSRTIAHYDAQGKPVEWRKLDAKIVKSILEM